MIPQGYKAAMLTPILTVYHDWKVYCHQCKELKRVLRQWQLENPWGAYDFNWALELECGHTESTVPQEEKRE